jgi:3-dehydroquinate synthetase
LQSGAGEVIKYAFLSTSIREKVIQQKISAEVIEECARFKMELVQRDPYEQGERKILNLGHTWGHAIEKVDGVAHGLAVILGLKMLFKQEHADVELKLLEQLLALLDINLPVVKIRERHLQLLRCDKKRAVNDEILFVKRDGSLVDHSLAELEKFVGVVV